MYHESLQVEVRDSAAWVRIRRTEMMNAISVDMWRALGRIFVDLAGQDPHRPVILRGDGARAFSSGSDLAEFSRMTIAEVNEAFRVMEASMAQVERLPMPVIAAINGFAMGSALELACACDVQIAAESARLGLPVARLGIMLSQDFVKRIVTLIGPNRTKHLIFSGQSLDARSAAGIGLVSSVVPDAELDAAVADLAGRMAAMSAHALAAAKRSVFSSLPAPEPTGDPPYFIHPDHFREGVSAFLEKRPPRFSAT